MIIINNKEIRNTVEQVGKNKEDIEELDSSTVTKVSKDDFGYIYLNTGTSGTLTDEQFAECLKKYCVIDYQANENIITRYYKLSQSDYPITSTGNISFNRCWFGSTESRTDSQGRAYRRVQQFVISVNRATKAYTVSTEGVYDIYNKSNVDTLLENVISVDSDGNLNKTLIRTNEITSFSGEDSDCKGEITLSSGLSKGSAYIYAGGEESGASIYVKGTSAVDSEGIVEISGQTNFVTENRLTVNGTEQIAYLSDVAIPTNMVTTDTSQTIDAGSGNAIYKKIVTYQNVQSDNTGLIVTSAGKESSPSTTRIKPAGVYFDKSNVYSDSYSGYATSQGTSYFKFDNNNRLVSESRYNSNGVTVQGRTYSGDDEIFHTTEISDSSIAWSEQTYNASTGWGPITSITYSLTGNDRIAKLSDLVIPSAPTTDGTYTLKVTVSNGVPTYSWVLD